MQGELGAALDPAAAECEDVVDLELDDEDEYVDKLQVAFHELAAHALVTKVSLFGDGIDLNKTGVRVSLDTSFVERKQRQFSIHCSERKGKARASNKGEETPAKPTQLDALMEAKAYLHREFAAPLIVAEETKASNQSPPFPNTPPESSVFDKLMAASVARRGLEKAVEAAAAAATAASLAESKAVLASKEAAKELAAAKARLDAMGAPSKRRRKATMKGSAMEGTDMEETADGMGDDDEQPSWLEWPLSRWRKHERESQSRRQHQIDPANLDHSLPPRGDDGRGWRWHWRRGLVGAVLDWAEGSRFRVAFMLAELAMHFEVQQQVSTALKCIPSRHTQLRAALTLLSPSTVPHPTCFSGG